MINDPREFELINSVLYIDGIAQDVDFKEYAKSYMKEFDIAPVGCSIVYSNVMSNGPKPSGKGTMYNLFMLFAGYKETLNGTA